MGLHVVHECVNVIEGEMLFLRWAMFVSGAHVHIQSL